MTNVRQATLVDSNVLLDVLTEDPSWVRWSAEQLGAAVDHGPVLINQIVYGEVAHRFSSVEELDRILSPTRLVRGNLPWVAAFFAAVSYREYRRRGGRRTAILPDFFIGAHAATLGIRLLTRDPARYRTHFPKPTIIAPH